MIRKILLAALLVAPLALAPTDASAQERGSQRAAVAAATLPACPVGQENRPAGQAVPAGLETRCAPPAEECPTHFEFDPVTGAPIVVDCHGEVVGE